MEKADKKQSIGMAASAKLLGLRMYYGLAYRYGRARSLTLNSQDDFVVILGRRYPKARQAMLRQGSHEAFTPGGSRVKDKEEDCSEHSEVAEQKTMEQNRKFFANNVNIEDNAEPLEAKEETILRKNLSDSPLDHNDQLEKANCELQETISMLACFTYRSHWDKPIPKTHLFSDAGWGCMIRAGQMCFFNCLIRDQLSKNEDFLEDRLKCLLIQFNDNLDDAVAPFSIQNIVPLAYERFSIPMGNWFRSTSIMLSLDQLNCKYQPSQTKHIKMVTMIDATFTMSKSYEALYERGSVAMAEDQIIDAMKESWGDRKLIITLSAMLGADKPQPEFDICLNYLLSLPWSMGALGGRDNKAYYIFGLNEKLKTYYYMDPHSVQVIKSLTFRQP